MRDQLELYLFDQNGPYENRDYLYQIISKMLIRIVKLTLQIENIASFEHIFAKTHEKIRNFEGCLFLELYQDQENPGVFFTYSQWKDASYLEAYRNSNLFQETWGRTKVLFAEKPEAWSVTKKNVIKP